VSAADALLAAARDGKAPPVVLLHGEEYLARKAAEELVALLVPESQRSLNLSILEAAASPAEVARDLATVPMFRGTKVVWLREPEFLAPRKAGKADQLARLRELWNQGREKEAVRRLLALAQKLGLDPAAASASRWEEEAGIAASAEDLAFCKAAAAYAAANDLRAPGGDTGELERLLERGIPSGHHLVISSLSVDGRLGLTKKLGDAGVAISFRAQGREGRDVGAVSREALEPLGKSLAPAALRRLEELVGGDQVRLLHAELEKVALFVGERARIEAADVDAVVERSHDIDFLLTNSVEKRDLRGALEGLSQVLEGGGGLPQVVATLATCVRQLLAAFEATRRTGGRIPAFGGASAWVEAYEASGLRMANPNQARFKAEAAARFRRGELIAALAGLGELDVSVKTGGGRRDVERFLWQVCGL
jgi:DNA polymerase-3 subunit delta